MGVWVRLEVLLAYAGSYMLCRGVFITYVESLYVDAHEPIWMLDVKGFLCSICPRLSLYPNIARLLIANI